MGITYSVIKFHKVLLTGFRWKNIRPRRRGRPGCGRAPRPPPRRPGPPRPPRRSRRESECIRMIKYDYSTLCCVIYMVHDIISVYIYIYIYVYVYICMHVCMYIYIYICMLLEEGSAPAAGGPSCSRPLFVRRSDSIFR